MSQDGHLGKLAWITPPMIEINEKRLHEGREESNWGQDRMSIGDGRNA